MDQELISKIISEDNSFNEATFKSYVDNMYVKIYSAIMYDELDTVKHFMTEELYQNYKQQIEHLNSKNLRQMYDELNVKSTSIIDFKSTDTDLIITVHLTSRYLDYYLNKETGDFVSGNNQSRVEKQNILTFTKRKNFLTQKVARKCPGCGASISVNTNGICSYCGTTYNLEDYDYILTGIKMQ